MRKTPLGGKRVLYGVMYCRARIDALLGEASRLVSRVEVPCRREKTRWVYCCIGLCTPTHSLTHYCDRPTTITKSPPQVKIPNPSPAVSGGLAFSEFVEFVGKIAMQGLRATEYDRMFPTAFLKFQGILTVFGVADMDKLNSVRIMHAESVSELQECQ